MISTLALYGGCVDDLSEAPEEGSESAETGDGDGDPATATETETETGDGDGDSTTGDGDGDPTTGDGDGDLTTGDGDGDPTTGDGDGDPTTGDGDGDPTTGDGDGDPTTGDGDGDPTTGDGDGDPTTGDGDGDLTTGDGDGDLTTGDGDGDLTTGDGDGDLTTGDGDGDTTGDGDGDTGDGDGEPPDELCLGPVFVDVDAPDDGDGMSWASAFNDLQAAVDAAQVCDHPQLWVAGGVYAPDPNQNVALLTYPIAIFGGFAGGEDALEQRDLDQNPTQLGAPGWQTRIVDIEPDAIDFVEPSRIDGFIFDGSEAGAMEVSSIGDLPQELGLELHNLVFTNNLATDGGALRTQGWVAIDIVNAQFSANEASSRGAAIFNDEASLRISNSSFIANESPGGAIHQISFGGLSFFGHTSLSDSVMSDNLGGALQISSGSATNTVFTNNSATFGGAARIFEGSLLLTGCTLTDNSATLGGALYLDAGGNSGGSLRLVDTLVANNTAEQAGAAFIEGSFNESLLRIEGSELRGNTATAGNGGALVVNNFFNRISDTLFIDNVAEGGGAIWASAGATELEVSSSRFINNQATNGNGGAVLASFNQIEAQDFTLINSELVGNQAAGDGGGVHGRVDLVASTLTNNSAANLGDGVAAPEGFGQMRLNGVVAWPDDIVGPDILFDHACVPQPMMPHAEDGMVVLVADPFEPEDLELDGLTEFYLRPDAPCVDVDASVLEFEWTSLTTQVAQCTDADPMDAGVHYEPQLDVGPCP